MFQLLMLALAVAAQDNGSILRHVDPPQGPMAGENRTLSQPYPGQDLRTFPDIAIKDLRIDKDTLYVLVTNEGEARAKGPIRITARAEANGVKSEAPAARIGSLKGGESRWVPLTDFSVKTASTAPSAPIFTLDSASIVSAAVRLPPPATLDRSGQGCVASRGCIQDLDETNNGLSATGSAIARGRPE